MRGLPKAPHAPSHAIMDQKPPSGEAQKATIDVNVPSPPVLVVKPAVKPPAEAGGPKGLEPTRYGDWERKGRCIDF